MSQSLALPIPEQASSLRAPVLRLVAPHTELLEWLALLLAAPFLLFPSQYVMIGAGILALGWIMRRVATGTWSVASVAHAPIGVLLLTLGISLFASIQLDYSAPKFWGLVLGVAAFYASLNACRTSAAARRVSVLLLLAGALVSVVGVLAIGTVPDKGFADNAVIALVPRLSLPVQTSTVVTQGFSSNEVGGALTLFAPLAAALATRRGWRGAFALLVLPLLLAGLYLAGSRAALTGVAIALMCGLLLWIGGRIAVAVTAVGAAVVMPIALLAPERLVSLVVTDTPVEGAMTMVGRVELWQHGLAMILDTPFTGIGLNNFPIVLDSLYPTIHHAGWNSVPHVHDFFLQTAVDLGLPGLVAFLAIAGIAVVGGFRALRHPEHSRLAAGLLLALLAFGIYSLVDAVTLGAKPSPLVWVELGLLVAIGAFTPTQTHRVDTANNRRDRVWLRWWRMITAIAAVLVLVTAVAPAGVNIAHLTLRRATLDANAIAALDADLDIAAAFAWGPYAARVAAARSYVDLARGDTDAELADLSVAAPEATWDSSLALRLADLRLVSGDRTGAVAAWQLVRANDALLDRAKQLQQERVPTSMVLDWYAMAQLVDPSDWRPYAAAAKLVQAPDQAAALLVQALHMRGEHPARDAVANRLVDASAALPSLASTPVSGPDADLYVTAARVMALQGDMPGALFAAQLATQADARSVEAWSTLADIASKSGRVKLAANAQQQRASLSKP